MREMREREREREERASVSLRQFDPLFYDWVYDKRLLAYVCGGSKWPIIFIRENDYTIGSTYVI